MWVIGQQNQIVKTSMATESVNIERHSLFLLTLLMVDKVVPIAMEPMPIQLACAQVRNDSMVRIMSSRDVRGLIYVQTTMQSCLCA